MSTVYNASTVLCPQWFYVNLKKKRYFSVTCKSQIILLYLIFVILLARVKIIILLAFFVI